MNPLWLAAFFGISEVFISTFLRKQGDSKDTDKGSLRMLWMTINICMIAGIVAYVLFPAASFAGVVVYRIGLAVFIFGIALRWYSIAYLGRFFTVNVAVASDQSVIDTGPYKLIRHPSYTGVLLAFLGVALLLANYVTVFLLTVPIGAAFLRRIRIEEDALLAGLGSRYSAYMSKTRRLIPYVY